MIRTFPEKLAGPGRSTRILGQGSERWGLMPPCPQRARSAAAPDGAPPRRIREGRTALAPPCPVRGPEAGGYRNFLRVWKIRRGILGFPVTSAKSWFMLKSRIMRTWNGMGRKFWTMKAKIIPFSDVESLWEGDLARGYTENWKNLFLSRKKTRKINCDKNMNQKVM
jgi:hypothetical protein